MVETKIILSGVSSVVSKCGNAGDSDSVMFLRGVPVCGFLQARRACFNRGPPQCLNTFILVRGKIVMRDTVV